MKPGGHVAVALRGLQADISDHLRGKSEEWARAAAATRRTEGGHGHTARAVPSLTICGVVAASGRDPDDLHRVRDEICRLAGEDGTDSDGRRLFPSVGQTVPVSWARVGAVVEALHEGGEPSAAARSVDNPVVPVEAREKLNFVTWEAALEEWSTVVNALELTTEVGETSGDTERVLRVNT